MSPKKDQNEPIGENPALRCLDAFEGTWNTKGIIKGTEGNSPIPIEGTDTYEWLSCGWFLLHKMDVRMGDEQTYSTEIIGYDSSSRKYPIHYFGHQGSTGVMYAEVDDKTWTFTGKKERFIGSFNESGDKITGKWEQLDDSGWVHWMDINLTKIDEQT